MPAASPPSPPRPSASPRHDNDTYRASTAGSLIVHSPALARRYTSRTSDMRVAAPVALQPRQPRGDGGSRGGGVTLKMKKNFAWPIRDGFDNWACKFS